MHGGLKDSFQWRTNFREVEEQVHNWFAHLDTRLTYFN